MKTEEIIRIFTGEFKGINSEEKFIIFKMKYQDAHDVKEAEIWDFKNKKWNFSQDAELINKYVWHPGNYLFWRNDEVIRVGRALDNARKRALVYRNNIPKIRDVYEYIYKDIENTELILFSLKNEKDKHWAAAIEIFFDEHEEIKPVKRSKKLG